MFATLADISQTLVATAATIATNANVIDASVSTTEDNTTLNSTITPTYNIEPSDDYIPPFQRAETYIITVLFAIIFIVGVLGNGTLVIIFFRHRSMRNIPNTYILSLAFADLLVIIVCVPVASIVYTQESWPFGAVVCRLTESFKDISIGVSVFTLTALSGERYCAIVNPLRKLQTKPLTVFTAVMIWLVAILLATPSLVVSDVLDIDINDKRNLTIYVCSPFGKNRTNLDTYSRYTVISKALIYYIFPLSIIGALYILMARRLHMSAREMPGEMLGIQSRSQARARRHVARMVVAFVVVFFVCFFPYHLFELWFHLNPTAKDDFDEFWHAIRMIGFCASFLHSCVNPVALYLISGVFRQHFNCYLCCLCVKRQPRKRQHSTATGMMDTSIMSMRRSNTVTTTTNYNRASLHLKNSTASNTIANTTAVGMSGCYRQPSMQLHHKPTGNDKGGLEGNGTGSGNASAQQSIILSDKR